MVCGGTTSIDRGIRNQRYEYNVEILGSPTSPFFYKRELQLFCTMKNTVHATRYPDREISKIYDDDIDLANVYGNS